MSTTRIGTLAVRWILESPRARSELRLVDPIEALKAAIMLLDSSFEQLVIQDAGLAHAVADVVDVFHQELRALR